MKDNNNEPTLPDKEPLKKPYEQPDLQVYGDLRDITQATGMGMKGDGGGKGGKTTP